MNKFVIGITLGDPAGIGPEVFLKGYKEIKKVKSTVPLLIGDIEVIYENLGYLNMNFKLKEIKEKADIDEEYLNVYTLNIIRNRNYPKKGDYKITGLASFEYVNKAVDLWKEKIIDGMVNLPISKKAWHIAGKNYPGHTEFLAEKFKTENYAMIMMAEKLRVLLITTHIPLKKVPEEICEKKIVEKTILGYKFLLSLGIKDPSIGVCALNPHSGEKGEIGKEEELIIEPAVKKLKEEGIKVKGPVPSDSIFREAMEKKYDLVIAMYHDQALIPLKTLFFEKLVNITAGIKMVRTSPGHGTGFDIAYQNKANPSAFIEAYKVATKLLQKGKWNF